MASALKTLLPGSAGLDRRWALGLLSVHLLTVALTYSIAGPTAEAFGARWLLALRVPVTVLAFLALGYGRSGPYSGLGAGDRARLTMCGILVVVNQGLFLLGMEEGTPPAHAAILYTTTPVLVFVISVLSRREPMRWGRLLGILLAFAGTFYMVGNSGIDKPGSGEAMVAGAVLCWSFYTVMIGGIARRVGALEATCRSFMIGLPLAMAFPLQVFGLGPAPEPVWQEFGWLPWYGLAHLAVVMGVGAYSIWATGLKVLRPSQVAVFTNLQPPAATLMAMAVHAHFPDVSFWLVLPLVLLGVGLVQYEWKGHDEDPPAEPA